MDRTEAERFSARIALFVGFVVTSGVWAYTGYSVTQEVATLRTEAASMTARYDQAQQLLTTVRTQVLLISVQARDALLDRSKSAIAENRENVEESFHLISMAIEDYEPIARPAIEGAAIRSLRLELDRFHQASLSALEFAPGQSPAAIRAVLNDQLTPRREAALHISEEIQALNRQAYIGHQVELAGIYEAAERRSRRQLGIALALSLGVLLMTSLYAARLDTRLRMLLKRDVRLSMELHDTGTQLLAAREEIARTLPPPE